MSCSNNIQLNTQLEKYKKRYFTEINTHDTVQCMLLNKYVKYNRVGESPTFIASNSEENKFFFFANVLECLTHEENEFIIQSNTNDHFYYKTKENKKDKSINFILYGGAKHSTKIKI
jgi:hypothetical protein